MTGVRNFKLILALATLVPLLAAPGAQAQTCDAPLTCEFSTCRTPAKPAPSALWGELRPAESAIPADRDSTDHTGKTQAYDGRNAMWFSVDIENDWIFTAHTSGFEVWSSSASPASPVRMAGVDGRRGGFPQFPANPEMKFPVSDLDAPTGDDSLVAVAALGGVGLSIWDTTDKGGPRALYQDYGSGREFDSVYATKIRGNAYAFAAGSGGVRVYDMTKAKTFTTPCLDEAPANTCAGVYRGQLGSRTLAAYVSGAGSFVAVSSGIGVKGVDIYNVDNISSPVFIGTWAAGEYAYGNAMWTENNGTSLYLAVRAGSPETLRIYNVSCALSGPCTPGAPVSQTTLNAPGTSKYFVTYSRSGSTPFLYLGAEALCAGAPRMEWLFDVSVPSAPRDITPADGVVGGVLTGYWQWYSRSTATGFNWVAPRRAKFNNEYLYRAAVGIFDVHKLGSAKPNPAFTWSPSQVFVGTPVTFTDQTTGNPTSWTWTFAGGTPGFTSQQNPSGVTFASTGPKDVSLTACNNFGCSTPLIKTVTVVDPQAAVTGVTVSPSALSSCVTATFTATGVTGKAPLAYEWTFSPVGAAAPTVINCTSNPCTYVVPADLVDGNYEVKVKVTNAENPTGAVASKQVVLDQQILGFIASSPSNDPTTTGTVKFHILTTGAKEWAWDFGTGSGFGAWSSDPVTGPNPSFTYTISGNYSIRAKIRDCNNVELTSQPLNISVTAIPLVADFAASCFFGACAFDAGTSISFTDSSSGNPESWSYDWNHTGTSAATCNFTSTGTSPQTSHTYSAAGTYQPCLRVTRGPDSSVFVHAKAIMVAAPTPPKITVSGPSSGTTGSPVTFSASASNCSPSSSGWRWSIGGGGSGSSTSSSISVTWSSTGTKTVSVSNTSCGSASGTKSVSISGGSTGTTLTANYTYSPTTISAGQSVSFDGRGSTGSPTIYQWTFGDGTPTVDGAQATHTFANGGTFQVTLSVAKPGSGTGCSLGYCTDTETKTIVVSGEPIVPLEAAFTYSPETVKAGKPVSFDGSSSKGTPTIWEWDFGDGTPKASTPTGQHTYANPGTYQVKLSVGKPGSGTGCSLGVCIDEEVKTITVEPATVGICEDDPGSLCLNNGRFRVQTTWKKPGQDGKSGRGQPIGISDDTGYFWFEYDSNVEVVVKVLDGCAVNGHHWVFATGLTNIEVTMTVIDKQTGRVQTYINPQGEAFAPIQDTKAFVCSPSSKVDTGLSGSPSFDAPVEWVEIGEGDPIPVGVPYVLSMHSEAAVNSTCVETATSLCLNNGRFRVEAWWETPGRTPPGQGIGYAESLGSDTGYFWFFNKANVELIIKVLDGCSLNSRYWVFAGGLTDVGVTVMVTDTVKGGVKIYSNPDGVAFQPKQDTDAIAQCN